MTIELIKNPFKHSTSNTNLLDEEIKCVRYLEKLNPSLIDRYMTYVEKGRKAILHKLASSVLRENIYNLYEASFELRKIGTALVVNVESSENWRDFIQQIQHYPLREDIYYKVAPVNDTVIVFPIENEFAYQRVETTDDILIIDQTGISPITVASDLLKILVSNTGNNLLNAKEFMEELDNGTANLTLAYTYEEGWSDEITQDANRLEAKGTFDYLFKKRDSEQSLSLSLFFEQMIIEGHHLHPGAKTKIGLTKKDVVRYSPEFHHSFPIRFVAVKKSDMITTKKYTNHFLETHYPLQVKQCCKELNKYGFNVNDYEIVPVHEWQYEQSIPTIYRQEIKEERVVFIKGVTLEASSTSSFRTVYPTQVKAPAIKLAVNSQMTSTVRSISTQTALNSTLFTKMITTVMKNESHLKDFLPLNELAGAAFNSKEELKSRNLTMLLRENLDSKLLDDEVPIAGPAFYATSPISGKTILVELVHEFASESNLANEEAPLPFFEEYISKVIPGYLTLMVKYGIALEGHLQNSVPVFKNGKLTRFYFRDWGGARIYKERMDRQGINIDFTPGSISVTEQVEEMHNKLYYTVFQNHLGEIIRHLVKHFGIEESELWRLVREKCDETFQTLSMQEDFKANITQDKYFLYQTNVKHKSLTKMRLTREKGYSYTNVPNPLASKKENHG